MTTLRELLEEGEKVIKEEKKKPKESELRDRYNLDALLEMAKRTLIEGETYRYPHKEFAEVIGFEPTAKIKRPIRDGRGNVMERRETEYNVSIPNDLRAFIESKNIDRFDDTVRIRMDRKGNVIVEPYKEFQRRKDKKKIKRR
ncbi:MAG: hypothetical protein MASP_00427 [Candidatus Methanolliviera sp. GoM_asphalt]|nr:MAG: hypothetical protein MASP_00427 [Candidatus Methanolliviera sp. GoM_asphalt]